MRLRLYLFILAVLIGSAAALVYVHIYFFRDEPLTRMDERLRASATELLRTPLVGLSDFSDRAKAGQMISAAIGDDRIGQLFLIRDSSGILFRNFEVPLLSERLPVKPGWHSRQTRGYYLRLLNVEVPGHPGRILQVGTLVDVALLDWKVVDFRVVAFIVLVVALLFLASIGLSAALMAPVRTMNRHLTDATSDMKNLKDVAPLPSSLLRIARIRWSRSDDFSQLIGPSKD